MDHCSAYFPMLYPLETYVPDKKQRKKKVEFKLGQAFHGELAICKDGAAWTVCSCAQQRTSWQQFQANWRCEDI
jgi:hypothetical protein